MYLRLFFLFFFIKGLIFVTSAQCTLNINDVASTQKNPSCYGSGNGSITVAVTGQKGAVTYKWGHDTSLTTPTVTGLFANAYQIIVTDTVPCTDTGVFLLSNPPPLSVTSSKTITSCHDSCDGTVLLSTSGGVSPYSYLWGNGNTSSSRNLLCKDDYSVTVTDSSNCDTVHTVSISEPMPLNANLIKKEISCACKEDGSVTVTATGETSPYTYKWSNGSTAESINNLAAGTYSVTVNDSKKCDTITLSTVIDKMTPFTVSVTTTPSQCVLGTAAIGSITGGKGISGGIFPFSYSWNTGGTASQITGLSAGTYSVTVTDSCSCTASANGIVLEKKCDLNPSSGFSPNDDNINDKWEIKNSQKYTKLSVRVFNRWGQKVHNQQGLYTEWDGTSFGIGVPDGIYYYIIVYDKDNKESEVLTGSVAIIR